MSGVMAGRLQHQRQHQHHQQEHCYELSTRRQLKGRPSHDLPDPIPSSSHSNTLDPSSSHAETPSSRPEQSFSHSLPPSPLISPAMTHPPTSSTRTSNTRIFNAQRATVLLACAALQIPIWGFAISYGIFQAYYETTLSQSPHFHGSLSTLGVIGTTMNGVMYISLPFLSAALCRKYASWRRSVAMAGILIACVGFLAAGFCSAAWGLVLTQGVIAALGCALVYAPTTLVLSEFFGHGNRALAYGLVLSAKNVTGSGVPFLMRWLLDEYGLRTTMVVWAVVVGVSSLVGVWCMPMLTPDGLSAGAAGGGYRARRIPWGFLRSPLFWVYAFAIMLQSSGYGIPQTYLGAYAKSVTNLSQTQGTLLITLFNAPGILASSFFGFLSDNKRRPMSASACTFISALASGLAAFLLWGMAGASSHSLPILVLFAVIYGFFAGGYSATWGGIIKEMEDEAATKNEAIDTGMVYGLLNGARGIGYVGGGLAGVQLLEVGSHRNIGKLGYGTAYGPLIVYTGLSTAMGGWSMVIRCKKTD